MAKKTPLTSLEFRISIEGHCESLGAGEPKWLPPHHAADLSRPKTNVSIEFKCIGGEHNPAYANDEKACMMELLAISEKFADASFVEEWKEEFLRRITEVLPWALVDEAEAIAHACWVSTLERHGIPTHDKAKTLKYRADVESRRVRKILGMRTDRGRSSKLDDDELALLPGRYKELCSLYEMVEQQCSTSYSTFSKLNDKHQQGDWKRWWVEHGSTMFQSLPCEFVGRFADSDAPDVSEIAREHLASECGLKASYLKRYVLPKEKRRKEESRGKGYKTK